MGDAVIDGLTDDEVAALGAGGVVVRDGALSDDERARYAAAALALDAAGGLRAAGVSAGGEVRPAVRGDRHVWLDDLAPPFDALWARFDALRVVLDRELWLGLRHQSVQLAVYPGGGAAYVRHRDAFRTDGPAGPARRMTAILYLHDAWTPAHGGELVAYVPDGPRTLEPLPGRLVLFLADRLEHEVRPAHAVRLAATAWYRTA